MRAMAAGAGRALLLLCVVAVALPSLVQGFIPVQTFRRQHADASVEGGGWRRSGSLGGAGDVQPVHHLPKNFRHRFIHRPGKSLLEYSEGESHAFEVHPQWERRSHEHHHWGSQDSTLGGEHHQHHHDHARFRNHHQRDARVMKEETAEVPPGFFQRLHQKLWPEAGGPSGAWQDIKSKMTASVSGLADKLHTVGDGIKNWFSTSSSRVAPTISFSSEPTWLVPLARESPKTSGPCIVEAKLAEIVDNVLQQDFSSAGTESGTCAGMLEVRTRLLKHSVKSQIKSLCSGTLESPCVQEFCNFFNRHPRLVTVMVLSKFEVHPIHVVLKQENSLCADGAAGDIMHHLSHIKHRLHSKLSSLSSEVVPEQSCQVCFDQSSHLLKHTLKESLGQLCAKATCPKMRNACEFVKEHKHLAHSVLMLKLRPWEMAASMCPLSCGTPEALSSYFPEALSSLVKTKDLDVHSSIPEVPQKWMDNGPLHHQASHLANGCSRSLHRVMQLRGFGARFLPEVSRILQAAHGDGIHHPQMVIVEVVRRGPVDLQEILAGMEVTLQHHLNRPHIFENQEGEAEEERRPAEEERLPAEGGFIAKRANFENQYIPEEVVEQSHVPVEVGVEEGHSVESHNDEAASDTPLTAVQ